VLKWTSAAGLINQDEKLIAFLHMSILPQARDGRGWMALFDMKRISARTELA
jgi:hypothetical protein